MKRNTMQTIPKYKRKSWLKKRGFWGFISVVIVIAVFVVGYITRVINPIIVSIGKAKVKSLATKAINMAVTEVLCEGYTYDDIMEIKSDDEGNISYIQAHSLVINIDSTLLFIKL